MKLPRFTATTPPPRGAGLARAQDIGALTAGTPEFDAIAGAGRALQGAAKDIFQARQNRIALDDQALAGEADKRAFDAIRTGLDTYAEWDVTDNNKDPRDIKNYYDGTKITNIDVTKKNEFLSANNKDYAAKIQSLAKGFKSEKTAQNFINRWGVTANKAFSEAGNAKHNEYQEQLFLSNAKGAAANGDGDMETANEWIDIAEKHGLIGPKKAASEKEKNQELSIKSQASVLYNSGEYQDARDLVAESPLPTLEKESLLNTINLIKERNERKTKDLNYKKDLAVNEEFVNLVMSKDLTPDMVKESRLDEKTSGFFGTAGLSQKSWMQYASDSYKDQPFKTTPSGFTSASDTVLEYSGFGIDKELAYKNLLDSRYIHREITDNDFIWAINHINKPYEPAMADNIKVAIESNDKAILRGWIFDKLMTTDKEKEKARSVNAELIQWVDNEIEQKREPTSEQMHQKSAQLRAQSPIDKNAPTPQSLRELGSKDAYEKGRSLGYWN